MASRYSSLIATRRTSRFILCIGLAFVLRAQAFAEPWPAWRGPDASGVSSETGFPLEWSAGPDHPEKNILWKTELLGSKGSSSPVVWGPLAFITVQVGEGPVEGEFKVEGRGSSGVVENLDQFNLQFFVMAVRVADGSVAWAAEIAPGRHLVPLGRGYDYATSSCVTDGERVYSWFGTGPVTCFNMQGEGLWQRRLEEEFAPFDVRWGHGSSPILHDDKVILVVDHAPGSYVLAVDKRTGETVWKLDLGRAGRSYSTPVVAELGGREQMIVNWPYEIGGVDPDGGKLLWTLRGLDYMMVPRPLVDDGIIYTCGGERSGPIMAIDPSGDGVPEAADVMWRHRTGGSYIASMIKVGGELYLAGETGIIRALDAQSGEVLWKHRGGASYFASPVAWDGNICMVDEAGDALVFEAGREFRQIAKNSLGYRTVASPALSDGKIYIRTRRYLYCIGDAS